MNIKNDVSVVIPCFNDSKFVEQAIDSILSQTYKCHEIIVVDDGSNIETKNVLKTISSKITKLITQDNQGQSVARNVGIRESKGKYILVLDSDDYFEVTFVEKAINFFLKNNDVKIVSCFATLIFENEPSLIYKPLGGSVKSFLCSNNALGSAIFKKVDWEISGGYDQSMRDGFEDWEFYIRLLLSEGFAHILQEPLYNYRKRNNTTTQRANAVKYKLLFFLYHKHNELYKQYLDDYVSFLLSKIETEEQEKIKNTQRLEFKIGKIVLKPIRWIKSLLR